ncbi:MAG: hypothetical protein RLZ12_398 [Bacillota bacterium]|jgi:F-type H+-transporting ATPase subunit c
MDAVQFRVLMGGVIVAIAALAAAFGVSLLSSKYMESSARQPEVREGLFQNILVLLAFVEALPIIALVFGVLLILGVVGR